jgi:hypothetical protein
MTDDEFLACFETGSLETFSHRDHVRMAFAWARVVAWHATQDAGLPFPAFLDAHPQLLRRDLLSAHYSDALLFSEAARAGFVEPDLAPLP